MVAVTAQGPVISARGWQWMGFWSVLLPQAWLILHHSPWRDETQALLLAAQPLGTLFNLLHYEAHPAAWYLLLKAVVAIAGEAHALAAAQLLVAAGVLALVWFRSPFSAAVKLAICLSYFVLFEYGVIARSYGLGVLVFFAFVHWRHRGLLGWALLGLLANVALHTAMLAGVCALWMLAERRWSWRGAGMLVVGGLLSLATMWPAPDVVRAAALLKLLPGLLFALRWNSTLYWPADWGWPIHWNSTLGISPALLLGLVGPVLGVLAIRAAVHRALFLLFYAGLFAVSLFIYTAYPRHFGFAFALFIGLVWAEAQQGHRPNRWAAAWLAIMDVKGLAFAATAVAVPFSYAQPVADWARARGLERSNWAAFSGGAGLDVTAELGVPTYNLQAQRWNTYQKWDYDPGDRLTDSLVARRATALAVSMNAPVYVLADWPLSAPGLVEVARFDRAMIMQHLSVYRASPR